MNNIPNDIPKYRKKSQAKPPAKAKHKHVYEPCLLEIPWDWFQKPHERSNKTYLTFGSYCPICGRTGDVDHDRWFVLVKGHNGYSTFYERDHSEEGKRELNPATRTLPLFKVDSPFSKFIKIEEDLNG